MSFLESFGNAAKSFEDSLFARVSSVNDACTPQDAGRAEGFRNFDDHGSSDYEQQRHGTNYETGFGRADDGWRKGYGQTPSHMERGYGQMPPRQEQQQQGYGQQQHYRQTPQQQQHDRQMPPPQQHYRQTPQHGEQPLTRPSLPEPRRPSLPPPRGASRSATIAESFSAGPQRVQCALNPASFAAPSAVVSHSPPSPFLGAEQVGSNLEQVCQRAAADSAPAAAPTPVATADLLGGLDLGGPAPEQAFFEQPATHAPTGELDLLAPAAPAAGSGSFWDTFAPEQSPPAAAPTLDAALPAQGGAGWAGVQPGPGAADAVRREIRAAAAREDYAEAARLQAELRRLEVGEVGGGATAPLAQEQGGFERGGEAFDESEML